LIDVEDFAFCGLINGEENVVADEMLLIGIGISMILVGVAWIGVGRVRMRVRGPQGI
jgi:hypothetical protein